jgi:hypothetical protein
MEWRDDLGFNDIWDWRREKQKCPACHTRKALSSKLFCQQCMHKWQKWPQNTEDGIVAFTHHSLVQATCGSCETRWYGDDDYLCPACRSLK